MTLLQEEIRQGAKRAIHHGDFLKALDVANQGLADSPEDSVLLHSKALATLQVLGEEAAGTILDNLPENLSNNVELLCLRARIQKDRWAATGNPESILQAATLYQKASERDPKNEYPAINAATCWLLAGKRDNAYRQANLSEQMCTRKIMLQPNDFYANITLAESYAIRGKSKDARALYQQVATSHPARIRDLSSAHRQARLVAGVTHGDPEFYDSSFPRRRVLVVDHELIQPGVSRFEPLSTDEMTEFESRFDQCFQERTCTIGFACLTSMTEFLFIESLRERGISYHIFLPWSEHDLLQEIIPAPHHDEFMDILQGAESVRVLSQASLSTSVVSSHYSEMVMIGIATLLSQALDLDLDFFLFNGSDNALAPEMPAGDQTIKSILFADITGYSRLPERAIPSFVAHFLQAVAELIDSSNHKVLTSNTWGDALYLVFDDAESAGNFALELQAMIHSTDWASKGLPADFGIRTGLHAGPVWSITDPVIKRPAFTGFHVSWAARIEPRAAPNSIYTSEEFAALAALNEGSVLRCDYVGLLPLPKNFGEKRVYRLHTLGE